MNADGSKPTPLTDQQGEEANWSPDGTKIAFASTRDGDNEAPNPVDWNEELYAWRQTVQT
jgi:Tol biopolymer transport system component